MMDLEELHLSWWRGRSSRPDNQRAQKSDESEVSLDRQPHVCTIYTNFSVFTVSWSLAMLSGGGPIDSRLRIFLEWRCIGMFSEAYRLPFFAVLFFCSSCLDLHNPSKNVHNFLETTVKWDWRGSCPSLTWSTYVMLQGWWLWTETIQENTCFLPANVAGLHHGISICFPSCLLWFTLPYSHG